MHQERKAKAHHDKRVTHEDVERLVAASKEGPTTTELKGRITRLQDSVSAKADISELKK